VHGRHKFNTWKDFKHVVPRGYPAIERGGAALPRETTATPAPVESRTPRLAVAHWNSTRK